MSRVPGISPRSHFSLANIPFGIISFADSPPRPAVAIGDFALDLSTFSHAGGFEHLPAAHSPPSLRTALSSPTLNLFAALGRPLHRAVRAYLQDILSAGTRHPDVDIRPHLRPLARVSTHLPLAIGGYTDFYAGRNHASNCGALFRSPAAALQPNYTHLPVAYHGRASSVVVSGTPVVRPHGQILPDAPLPAAAPAPVLAPTRRLDVELELGAFVCRASAQGAPVRAADAAESIFGYVLLNDWSARDVQAWEYVPLGPFTAKNFATTVGAWVVLADALEPWRCEGLGAGADVLPYLREGRRDGVFDVRLEVDLTTSAGTTTTITRTNARNLLFSFPQMLAHHTISGCPMQVGDLLGSGTISGTEAGTYGSLLEQNQNGKISIKLNGGDERKFLEDGDTVTLRGWAGGEDGARVGFGECVGTILPAIEM